MLANEQDILYWKKSEGMELTEGLGIPILKGVTLNDKDFRRASLLGFNYSTNPESIENHGNSFVHFFLPDHLIERVWNNPDYYAAILGNYKGVIQPDFSQYVGMPRVMLIWQHYRRMWLAKYLENAGLPVIPAPCWSDEASFEYCFEGMPKNSCLCISTVGCMKNPYVKERFLRGLDEVFKQLAPSQAILYGKVTDDVLEHVNCPYVQVASEMKQRIETWKNSL